MFNPQIRVNLDIDKQKEPLPPLLLLKIDDDVPPPPGIPDHISVFEEKKMAIN